MSEFPGMLWSPHLRHAIVNHSAIVNSLRVVNLLRVLFLPGKVTETSTSETVKIEIRAYFGFSLKVGLRKRKLQKKGLRDLFFRKCGLLLGLVVTNKFITKANVERKSAGIYFP